MLEVLLFSLLGGAVSLSVGMLLVRNNKTAHGLATYATPFAAGVLLAAAFGDLLPEAIHESGTEPRVVMLWALFGLLCFFILERFLRFFHHHHEHAKEKSANSLIVIGDTIHNAVDGIAIGAAFLIDPPTGIVTAIAVAAHEIPQEVGDFGLLLKNGMERRKVIIVNVLSALATSVTALATFAFGSTNYFPVWITMAITAGFFIYIAASDIIPEIHDRAKGNPKTDIRPWLLLLGAVAMLILSPIAHRYIDPSHTEDNHSASEEHREEEHESDKTH